MNSEQKQLIYNILTNKEIWITEKYYEVVKIFPNYLSIGEQKKWIYEKIEWFFHDWLWTYFELLVYDKINEKYMLWQSESDKSTAIWKMENWKSLYKVFFAKNEYNVDRNIEIDSIKRWSLVALEQIEEIIGDKKVIAVSCSSQDYRQWNARDIFIDLQNQEQLNFSLKTDKSGKVAIFQWQTSNIYERVYKRFFNLKEESYEKLKVELFNTAEESIIRQDFENIALLTQNVVIKQFWVVWWSVNNLKDAKATNFENMKYFIKQLKRYKVWDDNSIIIAVNRLSWDLIKSTVLDEVDLDKMDINDFSFLPCKPRKYRYWTEPWIKYKTKKFVSFQIKHQRWRNPSNKFGDITIRLTTK